MDKRKQFKFEESLAATIWEDELEYKHWCHDFYNILKIGNNLNLSQECIRHELWAASTDEIPEEEFLQDTINKMTKRLNEIKDSKK